METVKISMDFSPSKYSDKELAVKVQFIIDQMTGNSHFTTPSPALTVVQDALNLFSASLTKMEDGNKQDTVDKNAKRTALEAFMKQEAAYVQLTSAGSELMIASSGFDTNKKKGPVAPLPMVTGIVVTAGVARGSINISWESLANAHAYEIKYTQGPLTENSVWTYLSVTKHKALIENLTRGGQYVFYIAGIGSDPSRIWSDEVITYVM